MNHAEDLLDALYDLKHDLGKYIRMPVLMLPKDADPEVVAAEVERAIDRTRKGPTGVRSAMEIYRAFTAEWESVASAFKEYRALENAVERAVAWRRKVKSPDTSWTRAELERDLTQVGETILALIREVEGGE